MKTNRLLPLLLIGMALSLVLAIPSASAGGKGAAVILSSTKAVAPPSQTVTKVTVGSMPFFDTVEIYVKANGTYLSAFSISLAGGIIATWSVIANCVDGVGSGCLINDGPGVAHLAAFSPTGAPTAVSKGLLLTITWTAKIPLTSANPGTTIVAPCFDFLIGGSTIHGIGATTTVYGSPPKSTVPAFGGVGLNQTSIVIASGSSHAVTIDVFGLNGFSSAVSLSATATGTLTLGPITPSSVNPCFGIGTAQLTISNSGAGGTVTVTGLFKRSTSSVTLTVT